MKISSVPENVLAGFRHLNPELCVATAFSVLRNKRAASEAISAEVRRGFLLDPREDWVEGSEEKPLSHGCWCSSFRGEKAGDFIKLFCTLVTVPRH